MQSVSLISQPASQLGDHVLKCQQRGSLWRLRIHMASFPRAGQRRGSRGLHFRPDEQSPAPFGPSSPECQPTSTNQGGEGTLGSAATARGGEGPRCPCAVAPKRSDPKSRQEGRRWEGVKGSTWDIGDIGDGGKACRSRHHSLHLTQALGTRSAQPCGTAEVRLLPLCPPGRVWSTLHSQVFLLHM